MHDSGVHAQVLGQLREDQDRRCSAADSGSADGVAGSSYAGVDRN